MKKILLILLVVILTSCVTEEGARKHKAKNVLTASSGEWHSMVYKEPGGGVKPDQVGVFKSRDGCMEAAMKHVGQKGYGNAVYSCVAVAAQ